MKAAVHKPSVDRGLPWSSVGLGVTKGVIGEVSWAVTVEARSFDRQPLDLACPQTDSILAEVCGQEHENAHSG